MEDLFNKLTSYTFALKDAIERTNESSERPKITKHLAAVAEMYALLHMHHTGEAIRHIVVKEQRSLSLAPLSGSEGTKVAAQWLAFANAVGVECGTS